MSKFSDDAKARRAQQAGVEPGPHGPVSERFMKHYYGPSGSPAPKPPSDDLYVAWMRYVAPPDWKTRIQMCNSDSQGAFRVYHERDFRRLAEALAASESLMQKAHADHCKAERDLALAVDTLNVVCRCLRGEQAFDMLIHENGQTLGELVHYTIAKCAQ